MAPTTLAYLDMSSPVLSLLSEEGSPSSSEFPFLWLHNNFETIFRVGDKVGVGCISDSCMNCDSEWISIVNKSTMIVNCDIITNILLSINQP